MKADYLDKAYRNVKWSTRLFTFSLLYIMLLKPITDATVFAGIGNFLSSVPLLSTGVISAIGFIYALMGSQYGQRNAKKRFFGLFGNLCFVLFFVFMIVAIVLDIGKHL